MYLNLKATENTMEYWHVWEDDANIYTYQGVLGFEGQGTAIPVLNENKDNVLSHLLDDVKRNGFLEVQEDALFTIVVQFPVAGWGSEADLDARIKLEDSLGAELRRTGNGDCDGGDIGSGSINIFLTAVNKDLAISTLLRSLEELGKRDEAIIAHQTLDDYIVEYPVGGKFRL